ncbi:hypothetical protein SDRG_02165 [Saprolegnia diclina VS20]|uniref:CobW C-terminal domain-containing protein n=1 Tax=Saprolegnia diclina (strain VS20) TaxID=1156394 RepID=T0QZX5_SAPDV|nr:hypothetical protein SDRG_02165 [Saprolegnia diclina VS20]EQC40261.1 hypothetical protein SDRG_02165 [Saprolegnia diclina VS20]|eukprot:XP_008605960.1 hypothetical protein SDRG_02165 [Saprolegnia diclina VS20]
MLILPTLDAFTVRAMVPGVLETPVALTLRPDWTVALAVEALEMQLLATRGLAMRVVFVFNDTRAPERMIPFHETIANHFGADDGFYAFGEVYTPSTTRGAAPDETSAKAKVPVVIMTGFLGAGKTSLLNNLLFQQRTLKIAVIENEFGEVAIDNDLLASHALSVADQLIVLENGCMCCTVRGDILGAFASIRDKVVNENAHLDMVLIETTGMADPLPIVRTITNTPAITEAFGMKGIVTVVDACNIGQLLEEENPEALSQILLADLIVVSKTDLVHTRAELLSLFETLREMNPSARIRPCVRGNMPFDVFYQLTSFDLQKMALDESNEMDAAGHEHCDEHCDHDHDHCDHEHDHDHAIAPAPKQSRHGAKTSSFAIVLDDHAVDMFLFAQWMRRLVLPVKDGDAAKQRLYRCKAILSVEGVENKLVFHAVGDVVEREWLPVPKAHGCKVVFIGRHLMEESLRAQFMAIVYKPSRRLQVAVAARGLEGLSVPLLRRLGRFLTSDDVLRIAQTSRALHAAWAYTGQPYGGASDLTAFQDLKRFYVHPFVPVPALPSFLRAWKRAAVDVVGMSTVKYRSPAHVDAAAVAYLELARLAEASSRNFLMDFTWREETLNTFFATPTATTSSTLIKTEYEYEDEDEFDPICDVIRFRLYLVPDATGHRLEIQIVGGKTSSQIYQVSFHSIHPNFQVHVAIPDHRMPRVATKEVFYPGHPFLHALKTERSLRFVVRVKPDGSGPLGEMCGCC